MHVLASVRASDISPAQKNELRDLIFSYSNGGHDQSVRHSLEQKLAQYAVQAISKPVPVAAPKIHEFGASRPAPAFTAATTITKKPAEATAKPEPAAPTPTPTPMAEPTSSVPPEKFVAAKQTVAVPESQTELEQPAEVTASAEAGTTTGSAEASLQRVKEIKALVNNQIGNPVNLVNINNDVGREYMGALLDAMKKISSGSSAASAMQRLESAYLQVEETLKNQPKSTEEAKPVAQSVAPAQPEEPIVQTPTPITPPAAPTPPVPSASHVEQAKVQPPTPTTPVVPSAPQVADAPVKLVPTGQKFSPISAGQAESIASETKMDNRPLAPLAQSEKGNQVETKSFVPAPVPTAQTTPSEATGSAWGPETDTLTTPQSTGSAPTVGNTVSEQQVNAAAKYQSASLAQSKTRLQTLEDLPSNTASTTGDPLTTKQVDDGLDQLLTDWMLFKKSGLFGTGPKGMNHPLYLKIKDLQIPLLLAGRFEGATQEIKQSVTDYMNGWRYEQGIVYDQGENFDHYLRRVIRHILDLHKKP